MLTLREAVRQDADALTGLAHASKSSWGYDASLIALWKEDLTFDAARIEARPTVVAEDAGQIVGVVAIDVEQAIPEMCDLWVSPDAMGRGVGRRLYECAIDIARERGAREMEIVSDPHAEGFYRRMGACPVGSVPSKPAGRRLPKLVANLR